jgi:hypothetical protein
MSSLAQIRDVDHAPGSLDAQLLDRGYRLRAEQHALLSEK